MLQLDTTAGLRAAQAELSHFEGHRRWPHTDTSTTATKKIRLGIPSVA